jgi:hypothetical protein
MATSETKRPIAENNAIETNALLSDFSDEAVDAGTGAEMRAAFGMSGTPNEFKFPIFLPFRMSSQMRRRFNAGGGFRKIRPQDEGTAKRNCDAISLKIALIRFMIFRSPFTAINRRACREPIDENFDGPSSHTFRKACACCEAEGVPPLPAAPSRAGGLTKSGLWRIGSRTHIYARRYALPPSPCLGQKTYIQYRVLFIDTSSECETLGRISQLFRY